MVIHLISFKRFCFYSIIFCFQFLNAQRDPIEDIVRRDTLDVFSLEHKSSLIPDDFKYKNGNLTFIFSKKDFLKELRIENRKTKKDFRSIKQKSLKRKIRKEKKNSKKIMRKNREVSFFDSNNLLDRTIKYYFNIVIERLLDRQEVKVFFKEEPLRVVHKIRMERIGDQYISTSIEYWSGDVFIIDKIENMVIE